MRLLRKFSVALALVGVLGMLTSNSAYAAAGGSGVVVGQGTITPGLDVIPGPQTVAFTGDVTGVFAANTTADAGTISCSFSGGSQGLGDNYAEGKGVVNGTCSGTGIGGNSIFVSCSALLYVRVGAVVYILGANATVNGLVVLNCTVTVAGQTIKVQVTGVLTFTATSANPTTSYLLEGTATAAG